jgi:hypothetical protein
MNQFDAWLNMSVDEQRPSHERFARSFEVYCRGKPPRPNCNQCSIGSVRG